MEKKNNFPINIKEEISEDKSSEDAMDLGRSQSLTGMKEDSILAEEEFFKNIGKEELSKLVDESLRKLRSQKADTVLRLRFGLSPYDKEHSIKEIAKELGVSTTRVRTLEAQALRRLRHSSQAEKLGPYWK